MRIGHVDNPEVAAVSGPTDGDSGPLTAGAIFQGARQDILDFRLGDIVPIDVRLVGCRIDEEPQIHGVILRCLVASAERVARLCTHNAGHHLRDERRDACFCSQAA